VSINHACPLHSDVHCMSEVKQKHLSYEETYSAIHLRTSTVQNIHSQLLAHLKQHEFIISKFTRKSS